MGSRTWPSLDSLGYYSRPLPRQCGCGQRHQQLISKDAMGNFLATAAAAYPPAMDEKIASAIWAFASTSTTSLKRPLELLDEEDSKRPALENPAQQSMPVGNQSNALQSMPVDKDSTTREQSVRVDKDSTTHEQSVREDNLPGASQDKGHLGESAVDNEPAERHKRKSTMEPSGGSPVTKVRKMEGAFPYKLAPIQVLVQGQD